MCRSCYCRLLPVAPKLRDLLYTTQCQIARGVLCCCCETSRLCIQSMISARQQHAREDNTKNLTDTGHIHDSSQ